MKFSCLFIILLICALSSFSQNRGELERRRTNTLREIQETESLLNSLSNSKNKSIERLNLLERKISLRNQVIGNLSGEVSQVDLQILESEKMVQSLGKDVKSIKDEYSRMIYLAYLNRGSNNRMMFIFSSRDFNQAYKRLKYLNQYSEYRKRQIDIIKGVQTSLGREINVLDSTRKFKRTLLTNQENENQKLKLEQDEKSVYLLSLKGKESELRRKLKEKMVLAQRLEDEIERFIRQEIERNKALAEAKALADAKIKASKRKSVEQTKKSSVPLAEKAVLVKSDRHENSSTFDDVLSGNFKSYRGRLPWPLDKGVISQQFGNYTHPVYKDVKMHNNGIDILTSSNANVKAVFDGEVRQAISIPGLNFVVIIKHGNFYTLYQNLVDVNVRKDDKIKSNQMIGRVATDVDSKSSVLHFEIYEDFKKLDPELWLSKN